MTSPRLRVFVVDDEPLARKRLRRLLGETGRANVVGEAADGESATEALRVTRVDAVFLDIQMPGKSGLELAASLPVPPWIVFVTAHDRYALRAFEVSAIDYVVKPVQRTDLARALHKLELARALPSSEGMVAARDVVERLEAVLRAMRDPVDRIAARVGTRYTLLEIARVTHFRAEAKATLAVIESGDAFEVDATLADLERRLDRQFVRIHRALLVNIAHVLEVESRPMGGVHVRLKGATTTELTVARDRVSELRARLGVRG